MGLIDDVVYGTKVLKDDIVNINTPHLVQSLARQYNSKSLQLHNLLWYQRHKKTNVITFLYFSQTFHQTPQLQCLLLRLTMHLHLHLYPCLFPQSLTLPQSQGTQNREKKNRGE